MDPHCRGIGVHRLNAFDRILVDDVILDPLRVASAKLGFAAAADAVRAAAFILLRDLLVRLQGQREMVLCDAGRSSWRRRGGQDTVVQRNVRLIFVGPQLLGRHQQTNGKGNTAKLFSQRCLRTAKAQ